MKEFRFKSKYAVSYKILKKLDILKNMKYHQNINLCCRVISCTLSGVQARPQKVHIITTGTLDSKNKWYNDCSCPTDNREDMQPWRGRNNTNTYTYIGARNSIPIITVCGAVVNTSRAIRNFSDQSEREINLTLRNRLRHFTRVWLIRWGIIASKECGTRSDI